MVKTNIIQRRELEPLWAKATKVMRHYEKVSNCIPAVVGCDGMVEYSKNPKALLFCSLCKRFDRNAGKLDVGEHPCSIMHLSEAERSKKIGSSVYTCSVGFFFWASPFFYGERYAGALMSSGILSVNPQRAEDNLYAICRGEVSRAEIAHYLDGIPEKSKTEADALAHMMLLCANSISSKKCCENPVPVDYSLDCCSSAGNSCNWRRFESYTDMERRFFACLRRGDNTEARNIAEKILYGIDTASSGNLECVKLKTVEYAMLLFRTGGDSGDSREIVETNNRYLKKIENSKTVDDVIENLFVISQAMAGNIFSFQGVRHASALRKAERFIWENYTRKISLKEVADVSGLSAPYFSTIFKDEMGENFSNYVNRLRVEKAAIMLKETDTPFVGISAACGFGDHAWFSKIFKNYTGISPCKYREYGGTVLGEEFNF